MNTKRAIALVTLTITVAASSGPATPGGPSVTRSATPRLAAPASPLALAEGRAEYDHLRVLTDHRSAFT